MGDFLNRLSDGLSTEGITKKDGKQPASKKHVEDITLNGFHKKVIEARIRQDNRKWIAKEIWITVFGGIALYLFLKALI